MPIAQMVFGNYRSDGSGTPTPTIVGANPWGDTDDVGTYTESRLNRYAAGSADGHRWFADVGLSVPVPPTITGITFEAAILATNGGTAPGATLRSAFVLYTSEGDYIGEFDNTGGASLIGVLGTGTVTADWSDASGVGSALDDIPLVFDGGYIRVSRYDNFVAPYSGNYTLRCYRIAITISWLEPAIILESSARFYPQRRR